ncbi:MAG: hypothetical protein AUG51_12690 [Acidobacteria bacterium 13_1_20CM_3_53_8]|nr:MAG: hypothetical protein AUG51_12690 [Acidobacteria bacterium 13_1_20CM_3_53_8]
MSSTPIADGAIAVDGSQIVAVGSRSSLAESFPDARTQDFVEAAIIPGLVNTHSHIELTALRGFLESEEGNFLGWLMKLTLARHYHMTQDDLYVSAAWGALEAARAGVTCLADAGDAALTTVRALRDVGLRGIVHQESFGPDPALAEEQLEKLKEKVSRLRELETKLVRVGVSPHAPYTVSARQLELVTDYALDEKLPLTMHAAESEAEELFMFEGRGPFAEALEWRGIEWKAPGISTIQYLERHGVLRSRPLLAHCVRMSERDLETLKDVDARVAHCPKSNAKLGHGSASYTSFLRHEIRTGFGSDSVASNNTCDILDEARAALMISRARGDKIGEDEMVKAEQALMTATVGGARALGLENEIGMLAEGMQADFAIVSLDRAHQLPVHDPVSALIHSSSGRDCLLTVVAGQEIFKDGRILSVDEEQLRARIKEIGKKVKGSLESGV